MSDFELVSGLFDAGIYLVGIVGGITLFLIGRRRGDTASGGVMRGFGVVLFLLFGLAAVPAVVRAVGDVSISASPTSTTSPTTTSTQPPTTTTTTAPASPLEQFDEAAKDVPAYRWAQDALAYAWQKGWTDTGQPQRRGPSLQGSLPGQTTTSKPEVKGRVLPAYDTDALVDYGLAMCEQLADGTEAQVEATMRLDLGIERWEDYGQAWFDSLVNGLCVRR